MHIDGKSINQQIIKQIVDIAFLSHLCHMRGMREGGEREETESAYVLNILLWPSLPKHLLVLPVCRTVNMYVFSEKNCVQWMPVLKKYRTDEARWGVELKECSAAAPPPNPPPKIKNNLWETAGCGVEGGDLTFVAVATGRFETTVDTCWL